MTPLPAEYSFQDEGYTYGGCLLLSRYLGRDGFDLCWCEEAGEADECCKYLGTQLDRTASLELGCPASGHFQQHGRLSVCKFAELRGSEVTLVDSYRVSAATIHWH